MAVRGGYEEMKLNAVWTNDCCGKKDYDGGILSISTRYWPRGGSAMVFDTRTPKLGLRIYDDGSEPSAHSSLVLLSADGKHITLTEKEFEAGSFQGVAEQVEAWAQEQMDKAVAVLLLAFPR